MLKCLETLGSLPFLTCLCLTATLCHTPFAYAANPLVELAKIYGLSKQNNNQYVLSVKPEDVPTTREAANSLSQQQISKIRSLLEGKKFPELNNLFLDLQQNFETDPLDEFQIFDACNVLRTSNPAYEALLVSWAKTHADHFAPHLALAFYYLDQGWTRRGTKWAKDTTETQLDEMRKYHDKAEKSYQQALAIKPNLLPAYIGLLGIYKAKSDDVAEKETLQKGLELFPRSYLLRVNYAMNKRPRWGGSFMEMEWVAVQAQEYASQNPKLSSLFGLILYDQAMRINRAKDPTQKERSTGLLTEALKFGDNYLIYHWRASNYYYGYNDYAKALADINRSIELRPVMYDSHNLRGQIHIKQNKIKEAIDDFTTSIFLRPFNNYDAFYWRGVSHSRLNDHPKAIADLKAATEQDPSKIQAYKLLDYHLAMQKKWPEIITHWGKFIEQNPTNGQAYFERSGSYYHSGNMPKAIQDLKSACSYGIQEACQQLRKIGYGI